MQPDQAKLDELVQRIVDAVHPLRIILFGSAARGDARPGSDLDVLVVMPEGIDRLKTAMYLHRHMIGMGVGVDFVVATPSILARHKDTLGLIYRTVLREGKDLYAA